MLSLNTTVVLFNFNFNSQILNMEECNQHPDLISPIIAEELSINFTTAPFDDEEAIEINTEQNIQINQNHQINESLIDFALRICDEYLINEASF